MNKKLKNEKKKIVEKKTGELYKKRIEESEKKYRIISEKTGHLIYDYDIKTGKVEWSGSIKKITGFTEKEYQKINIKKWSSLIHPDDREKSLKILDESQKKINNYDAEYRLKNKRGEYIMVEDNGVFISEFGNKATRMLGIMKDITERKKIENKLIKSEEKYKNLIERANDGVVILQDGAMKYANKKILKMIGEKKENIINKSFLNFVFKTEKNIVRKRYAERMSGKKTDPIYETKLKKKGGGIIDVELNAGIVDYLGKPADLVIVRDIRSRKKNQEKIKESEEKYRMTIKNTKGMFYKANPDWSIEYISGVEELCGYTEEDFNKKKKNWLSIINIDDRKKIFEEGKILQKKQTTIIQEYRIKTKKGKEIWVEDNKTSFFKGKGRNKVKFIIGFTSDITKRKIAELEIDKKIQEVIHERDKINAIVQGIGDGVFVIDKKFNIVLFNKVAEELSDYKSKEVIGKKYYDVLKFVFEKDKKENKIFIKEAIRNGATQKMKNHTLLIDKEGNEIPVADSVSSLRDEKGKITGAVIIFRDATKEREVERVKTEFVSIASHQLRTPLSGIKWFTELLLKEKAGELNKKQKDFIKQVFDSNERMIRLIEDLLDVTHIDTGKKFNVEKKNIKIKPIIEKVIIDNVALITKKRIKIQINLDCIKEDKFFVDKNKIMQVFYNTISNAIKYSKINGTVKIGCKKDNGKFIFMVKDRGWGIPKVQQKRVFEKFFRADNVMTKQTDGTGLGLYIASAIINSHDGKMWFESKEGIGSTFYFTLSKK